MFTLLKLMVKVIKWFAIITCFALIAVAISAGYVRYLLNEELPQDLREYHRPKEAFPTVVFDRHGNRIDEIFIHRRIVVPFEQFPPYLIQALLASEDIRFFSHFGIDPVRILEAFWSNIKATGSVEGSSTLTQQTARLFLLKKERKPIRKFKEILLALQIEQQFSKEAILSLYLNKIFLGNAEGVESAAQGYFGKHAKELGLAESALLVGLLPAPSIYAPTINSILAKERRDLVLDRMFEVGYITEEERKSAVKESIQLRRNYDSDSAATAYYVEHIRKDLLHRFDSDILYKGGLRVHIAMDLEYQVYAHEALQKGILELSRRQGFRGPSERIKVNLQGLLPPREIHRVTHKNQIILGSIIQGVVTRVSKENTIVNLGSVEGYLEWANLKKWKLWRLAQNRPVVSVNNPSQILQAGDVIQVKLEDWDPASEQFRLTLHQEPLVNGAIFSVDPQSGEVLAMSGGYRYDQSEFNRAIQAKRQPGSLFKPIIYASALDAGYTLASILVDSPRLYKAESDVGEEESLTLENHGDTLLGNVSLRTALVKNLDLPTIGLVEDLKPKRIIDYARKLGISAEIKNNLTIALGSFSTTLQEIVTAFGVFANEGTITIPIYITRVEDLNGIVLEENFPRNKPVISKETAYLILDGMRDVVEQGSGQIARKIERPSAGKTGTTHNSVNAWYIGFIPQLVTGVYVGFDQPTPMETGETGARAATPIWVDFMKSVTRDLPSQRFARPPQIVSVKIHKSGRRAGPCDPSEETYYEQFKRGTEPLIDPALVQQCNLRQETPDIQKTDLEL